MKILVHQLEKRQVELLEEIGRLRGKTTSLRVSPEKYREECLSIVTGILSGDITDVSAHVGSLAKAHEIIDLMRERFQEFQFVLQSEITGAAQAAAAAVAAVQSRLTDRAVQIQILAIRLRHEISTRGIENGDALPVMKTMTNFSEFRSAKTNLCLTEIASSGMPRSSDFSLYESASAESRILTVLLLSVSQYNQ